MFVYHITQELSVCHSFPQAPTLKPFEGHLAQSSQGLHTYGVTRLRKATCIPARAADLLNPRLNRWEKAERRKRDRKGQESYLFSIHASRNIVDFLT